MRKSIVASVTAFMAAGSVSAADRTATGAIVSGDYAKAEQALNAERRIFPSRPELMLNLAAVYRQTGRDAEARALYADVLRRDAVPMDMLDAKTISSHAIARAGLNRLVQVASR